MSVVVSRRAGRRRILGWVLVVGAVLGLLASVATVRVIVSGEQEIAASTDALRRGDPHEAAVRARRAAGWYAPGAPHVRVAYERLEALARAAESRRRDDIALLAWRAIRSAAIETRWVVTPHAADLARANREIARLSSRGSSAPAARAGSEERLASEQLALLERQQTPRLRWIVALLAGFAGWTSGVLLGAWRVAGEGSRVDWRRARWALSLTLLGIALWLLAVWRA